MTVAPSSAPVDAPPSVGAISRFVKTSATNVGLRSAAMAGKLVFLVLAARHLAVEDMALYALMATTVSIAVTLMGLEFYGYSTRELLAVSGPQQVVRLRDQLVLHGVAYVLLLPLSVPVFLSGVLPWGVLGWFVLLAVGEHLSQEVARVFNVLFRPVLSTTLFFFRSAAWGLVLAALWMWRPQSVTLSVVFGAWAAGIVVSLALAAREFGRMEWRDALRRRVDWRWIRTGIVVAGPFMISALSYRVMELVDRYIIHFLLDDAAVGVYSFYGMLANVLPALIGAAVSAILVPRIIHSYQNGDMRRYRQYFKALTLATVGIVVVTAPIIYAVVVALQGYLERPEYASELRTFGALLVAAGTSLCAQLPGVALYARRRDWTLLGAVVIGAVVNTLLNLAMIPVWGVFGAACAACIAYTTMGAFQMWWLVRCTSVRDNRPSASPV